MISHETKERIRDRAGDACEYCQLAQALSPVARLQIDHIIPRKHGGTDDESNLALACIDCNLHKGANLTGIDPASGAIVALFNPRLHAWNDHFQWNGVRVEGTSQVGRVTVRVLELNTEERVQGRLAAG